MGTYIKKFLPLTEEQRRLCPNGTERCVLCRLEPDDGKFLYDKRFRDRWTYQKILEYVRAFHLVSPNFNTISKHFNQHVIQPTTAILGPLKKDKKLNPEISTAITQLPKLTKLKTAGDLETAYDTVVKLVSKYTKLVETISENITIDAGKVQEVANAENPLTVMERWGRLQKEAITQLKEVTGLRAPKLMVAQYLEKAIDEVVHETGYVLTELSQDMQRDVMEAIRFEKHVTSETFVAAFRKVGLEYMKRMKALKRDQMAKAMAALAELEKMI